MWRKAILIILIVLAISGCEDPRWKAQIEFNQGQLEVNKKQIEFNQVVIERLK